MARADQRLFTAGRFWLAKRAQSPFYQIRWYDEATKTTRNLSTGCGSLEDAKRAIIAHAEADLATSPQEADEALAVPALIQYWKEHGVTRSNAGQIASSLRIFIAFLGKDRVRNDCTIAALKPDVFKRFMAWRMKPHSYAIRWQGKNYAAESEGVSGETVQRNLDDVRAALNHAAGMGRVPYVPKVPGVAPELRSPARDKVLTIDELGAIVGYAAYELPALRWVLGMIATAARPDAVLRWNVPEQWKGKGPNLDTHPTGAKRTKKRNAVVPVIAEFRPWLEAWADHPHKIVKSRKTWWRTMRLALGLDPEIVPKTIRHTIATELRGRNVPMDQIAGLLGHVGERRITAGYAKYDPSRLPQAKEQLSVIWEEICASAKLWFTNHKRITASRGQHNEVVLAGAKC